MWVYINSEPGLWTVGFYGPDGQWHPDSDHNSQEKAAERVNYLNGGRKNDLPDIERIEKISIDPDDVIIFKSKISLSALAVDHIEESARKIFPEHKIIVLEEGMELMVAREDKQ